MEVEGTERKLGFDAVVATDDAGEGLECWEGSVGILVIDKGTGVNVSSSSSCSSSPSSSPSSSSSSSFTETSDVREEVWTKLVCDDDKAETFVCRDAVEGESVVKDRLVAGEGRHAAART